MVMGERNGEVKEARGDGGAKVECLGRVEPSRRIVGKGTRLGWILHVHETELKWEVVDSEHMG